MTPTGQISTSLGGDMIFDVNRKETDKLIENLEKSRKDIEKHLGEVKVKSKRNFRVYCADGKIMKPFINGRYQREGYSVGKYAIMGEGDYAIPILLFVPNDNTVKHPALIYLHPGGKVTEAKPGGEIERLVRGGYVVVAADLPGVGETKNTIANGQGKADAGYTALLIGRSVVGLQAGDIIRVAHFLKTRSDIDTTKIGAMAIDEMCLPLIHAAAFDLSVKNVILIGSLLSYRSIAMNRICKIGLTTIEQGGTHDPYEIDFEWGVAGVLKAYDLPDLIGCIAPRKVTMSDIKDHTLKSASEDLIKLELGFPVAVYTSKGIPGNLRITPSGENIVDLVDWSFRKN